MFVQLNPEIGSYSETMSTLKFAERASGVELGAARSSKDGRDIRELMEQVLYLVYSSSRSETFNCCTRIDDAISFFLVQLPKHVASIPSRLNYFRTKEENLGIQVSWQ